MGNPIVLYILCMCAMHSIFNCMHSTAGGVQTVEGGTTAGGVNTRHAHSVPTHTSLYPKAMHYAYTVYVYNMYGKI